MNWPTIIAAILVASVVSAMGAAVAYLLQLRLKRLEKIEEALELRDVMVAPVPTGVPQASVMEPPSTPATEYSELKARLDVVTGPEAGKSFQLKERTLIGRDPRLCDIAFPDILVSRQHAKIITDGEKFYLYDLESTNGTFVNGQRVLGAIELHNGDRIRIGPNIELIFRCEDGL
ncbi:MAG TPA: FHA domain-containing protein [Chloroflexi bacterium]|nr:FHA domain-containing protein [Chloroflexota bacterium]